VTVTQASLWVRLSQAAIRRESTSSFCGIVASISCVMSFTSRWVEDSLAARRFIFVPGIRTA
jgi:hypothetical protein